MDQSEAIKQLQELVDFYKYQISEKAWKDLVDNGIVKNTFDEKFSYCEIRMKKIIACQMAIDSLCKENSISSKPVLLYHAEIEEEVYSIESIHNRLDTVLLKDGIKVKKSTLLSNDEECIHDGNQKCKVCGCNYFSVREEGLWWNEEDICSKCSMEV